MSEKFEVGGQCVCIIGGAWRDQYGLSPVPPTKGNIYLIVSIERVDENVFLRLRELQDLNSLYNSIGFRPCKKTDISLLEGLLKKKPSKRLLEEAV